jgi:hypothetical protein
MIPLNESGQELLPRLKLAVDVGCNTDFNLMEPYSCTPLNNNIMNPLTKKDDAISAKKRV